MSTTPPLQINGWNIIFHPLFLDQYADLHKQVEELRKKDPDGYSKKKVTKRLAAITKLAFDTIPQDPTRKEYRQGSTLGGDKKHWFRAKLFQQYRLFFRYHMKSRVIVFAWVNDDSSKRAYGSNTDAYRVFKKMLDGGNPPDDWDALLKEAEGQSERLQEVISEV